MTLPRSLATGLLAGLLAMAPVPSAAEAPEVPFLELEVRGRPILRSVDGSRVRITLRLREAVEDLDLRVLDFGGGTVRRLASGSHEAGRSRRTWNGRDDDGRPVPTGAYRIRVAAVRTEGAGAEGTGTGGGAESGGAGAGAGALPGAWVTVADREIHPRRPGFIRVAIDPGHGATRSGALGRDGTREADLNLDIALRLAAMLEGAGVQAVLTRDSDRDVNDPPQDLTADGIIDDTDELAARPDIANAARADLFISVHNNTAVNTSVGGPSTFFSGERPFSDRSAQLARIIQASMVEALSRFADASWSPYDHGALVYPYYVLRGYDPPRLLRPTQMPAVLSEGLFLSHPRELRLLKRPVVRQAMAEAYYEAIATYLELRPTHVGYELLAGPSVAAPRAELVLEVEVRNQGRLPMRGWRLSVGVLPAAFRYEGRGRSGRQVGERRIPRLEAGERATLRLRIAAPATEGDWLLLFEARDEEGRPASRNGSPRLQVPLSTHGSPPRAAPSAAPSPDL